VSQLFPPRDRLCIPGDKDFAQVLEVEDSRSAMNSPDTITITAGLVTKLYTIATYFPTDRRNTVV
jgi:hypothetical protein